MAIDLAGMAPLLQVFDMPTSIRFYRDVLGFEVVTDSGGGDAADWVLLRHGRTELMLNTAYEADSRPAGPDLVRIEAHSDTGLFFGCDDLDAAYAHLVANGVAAEPPKVAPYGMRQLYVRDPDGYVLCFQSPASEDAREQSRKRYGPAADRSSG